MKEKGKDKKEKRWFCDTFDSIIRNPKKALGTKKLAIVVRILLFTIIIGGGVAGTISYSSYNIDEKMNYMKQLYTVYENIIIPGKGIIWENVPEEVLYTHEKIEDGTETFEFRIALDGEETESVKVVLSKEKEILDTNFPYGKIEKDRINHAITASMIGISCVIFVLVVVFIVLTIISTNSSYKKQMETEVQ